jgi:Ran GTPase-activating protein (RanGAP) involved in mRNA processing and transport
VTLCSLLQEKTHYIQISGNAVSDLSYKAIERMMRQCSSHLIHLDLSNCQIGSKCVAQIAMSLHKSRMRTLILRDNYLSGVGKEGKGSLDLSGLISLYTVLCSPKATITHLDLRNTQLFGLAYDDTLASFRGVPSLLAYSTLADMIRHNKSICVLSLGHNFGCEGYDVSTNLLLNEERGAYAGVQRIKEALKLNASISHIDMSTWGVDCKGCPFISEVIQNNKTLMFMDLDSNRIGVKGALSLSLALQSTHQLMSVNLRGNILCDEGVSLIAKAVRGKESITDLDISHNLCSDSSTSVCIANILTHVSCRITKLNLSENKFNGLCLYNILFGLHNNRTLTDLNMSQNRAFDGMQL